jgi:D-alanyl-D-alanine carboxypeptidase/D-alanyl-D-alanine-endopeptidase (penicillin-binding protein 4)
MIAAAIIAALLVTGCGGARRSAARTPAALSPAVLDLQHAITARLAVPDLQRGTWGIVVKSLTTGQTLYALNPDKLLLPGSNMKVLTLAAAAERLGWDFTYETRVLIGGPIDEGTLGGDLIVVGTGDPTIDDWEGTATALFRSWAEGLKAAGIRAIAGRVVGDDNAFGDEPWGYGWAWDDLSASYAAAVGALQFNQNSARIRITPASVPGPAPAVDIVTPDSGLMVRNDLITVSSGTSVTLTVRRLAGTSVLELRGTVPAGVPPFFRNVSVDNPTLYFVRRLRAVLIESGIDVRGEAVDIDDVIDPPSTAVPVAMHRSAPLRALSATMMKLSQNLFAETLLRSLSGPSDSSTAEAGRKVVRSVIEEWGADPRDAVVADGSGLSRYNLVTAACLVAVLTHAHENDRLREGFEASLPLAGHEGTLAGRMKGTPAEANARAKSGALANARSLSGYVQTADGEPLVFAIMANHFGVAARVVEDVQDQIVASLARFSRR